MIVVTTDVTCDGRPEGRPCNSIYEGGCSARADRHGARRRAKEAGWMRVGKRKDLCPECAAGGVPVAA